MRQSVEQLDRVAGQLDRVAAGSRILQPEGLQAVHLQIHDAKFRQSLGRAIAAPLHLCLQSVSCIAQVHTMWHAADFCPVML